MMLNKGDVFMSRNKKLIILNIVIAIVCVALYVILIPHSHSIEEISRPGYRSIVETIPLKQMKVIQEALYLFTIICIPTIVYVLKKIISGLFINKKQDVE